MKKIFSFIFLTALLLPSQRVVSQLPSGTADSIKNWLTYLASDEMKGRANGTPEIENVAKWLSAMYKQYGLNEIGGFADYTQAYMLDDDSFVHKNIVGYIPPKEQSDNDGPFVVLTAHYDHIGMSNLPVKGDSIFNGADDNASGTVALLAIAKNMYEMNIQPECPIVFAVFSNEETGLRGSRFFCKSEVIPMQRIKVNINLEMLSHSDEYGINKYYITGHAYSNFQDIVLDFNKENEWGIEDIGDERSNMLYRMADNYAFAMSANSLNMCIPAHTVATSIGFNSHIHNVNDEVGLVDFENMSRLVDHLTQLLTHFARKDVVVSCK